MQRHQFSIDELRKLFVLDGGVVRWSVPVGRARPGMRAGTPDYQGYLRLRLRGIRIAAHRLAWALHFNLWPDGEIDHINGDKQDNRIENLRDVPSFVNKQNLRSATKRNKLGVLGVHQRQGRFRANISIYGAAKAIGTFASADEAHAAYLAAKRLRHQGNTL